MTRLRNDPALVLNCLPLVIKIVFKEKARRMPYHASMFHFDISFRDCEIVGMLGCFNVVSFLSSEATYVE